MTPRRLKLASILAGIALSALTLLAWTQRWYVITLETGQSLAVDGDVAAPALTALALSGLALAAALAIAGGFFRVVLGLLQASLGALIITSAAIAIADPVVASERAITDETGVAGRESIANLVSVVAASLWPYATLALGILLTVLGLAIVASSRRWPESSRKYSATTLENEAGERSAVGDWDALSDGRDPSV
ncbi:MAG: Trp biosynthesis-associated membrane protein [Microbacteriaceae bacterium]|nr:Trp biosynthesis-associated membrane protein [Microbacteriaceae bacterium]